MSSEPGPIPTPDPKDGWALRLPWFGPAVVTMSMLVLIGLLFGRMQASHLNEQQESLQRSLTTARDGIATRLDADKRFLGVLADQAVAGALISSEFHRLADSYIADHPHMNAVYYLRPDHTVLWSSPVRVDEQGEDALTRIPEHVEAFKHIAESETSNFTKPYIGLDELQRFDLYVPVTNRKKLLGAFVIAYVNIDLMSNVLDDLVLGQYQAELLSENGRLIYGIPSSGTLDPGLVDTISLIPPDNGMTLRLSRYTSTIWDTGTLTLGGICIALIIGMGLGLWALNRQIVERGRVERALYIANTGLERRVRERTHALSETNEMLAREMSQHQEAEERARQHLDHLAQIGRVSTMGEMAAGLAHELHQPLAAITSYAKACLRILNQPTPDQDRVRFAVTNMDQQSTRAAEIIDRLRRFLTPDSPEKLPLDLLEIIRESAGFVEPERKRLGIDLTIDVDDNVPAVLVDRVQLQQVLVNLMKNAFESLQTLEGVRRAVRIWAVPGEAGEVQVHVQDSGEGCKPEDLSRVFEPFVSMKAGGMGMGLSISRTIIEAHEGRLWATTQDGKGMTFSFTIKAADHAKA